MRISQIPASLLCQGSSTILCMLCTPLQSCQRQIVAKDLRQLLSSVGSNNDFWFRVSFPFPPPTHSLPQEKLRAKTLSLVICPWSGICISPSWNHSLKYLISIAMMLSCNVGKRFWVLLHDAAIWLNESKLPVFLPAHSWRRHSPIHLFPWCPAKASQKSALQILLYWYINTVTSAKEPSSHSDAW